MNRRTALTAVPLAIAGVTAAAKGAARPVGAVAANKAVLDARELRYAFEHITEASTADISCTFIAFAGHLRALVAEGDSQTIGAHVEMLIDHLYQEHNDHHEPRETWLAEEREYLRHCIDMDDDELPREARRAATRAANDQFDRRAGKAARFRDDDV